MRLNPEQQLILLCTNLRPHQSELHEIDRLSRRALNWQEVVRLARDHRIAPFVYYHLSRLPDREHIPPDSLFELKRRYLDTTGRNIALFEELRKLLGLLRTAEIDAAVLKGPALIGTIYENPGLRWVGDIDILVREHDLHDAQDSLLKNGYTQDSSLVGYYSDLSHHHLCGLRSPFSGITIELHWALELNGHIFNIDINEIWDRVQTQQISGVAAFVLAPEDMLLHLCLHHCYSSIDSITLKSVYEIAAAIQYYGESLDWSQVVARSTRYKLVWPIYSGLDKASKLFSANIPSSVFGLLKSQCGARQITRLCLLERFSCRDLIKLALLSSSKARLKYLLSMMFPSVDFLSQAYSIPPDSTLIYLLYLIRPLHVVRNLFFRSVKRIILFAFRKIVPASKNALPASNINW